MFLTPALVVMFERPVPVVVGSVGVVVVLVVEPVSIPPERSLKKPPSVVEL